MTPRHDPDRDPTDAPEAFRQHVRPLAPPPGAYQDIRQRARSRRRTRVLWSGLALACCAAGGAVALNAVHGDPAPSTVAVSSDDTPSQSQPRTEQPAAPNGQDTSTPGDEATTGQPKSTQAGPTTCRTSDLKVTLGQGEGAAGSQYRPLRITNNGSTACSLFGFPGVSMVDAAGKQVGKPADRSGSQASGRVVMKPGQQEQVTLRIVNADNYGNGQCHRTGAAGIRVYPPGERHSVVVAVKGLEGCASSDVQIMTVTSYGVH